MEDRRWKRRQPKWDWKAHLTEQEAADVLAAERAIADAKYRSAEATMLLNPIRNRAIHRAKYAALKAPPPHA